MPQLSYCANLVRLNNRSRYICTLFAPQEVRECWFTLFAFEHEISSISQKTGEEMIGFIRFAWWRETLVSIFAQKPPKGHPVAEALAVSVQNFSLSLSHFEQLIDAHEKAFAEWDTRTEQAEGKILPLLTLCRYAANVRDKSFPEVPEATLRQLAIALALVDSSLLPEAKPEQVIEHAAGVRQAIQNYTGSEAGVFTPLLHWTTFCLKRLEKGVKLSHTDYALRLPLYLWRRHVFG